MSPDKPPGPDSLNPAFYQNFWDVRGLDIFNAACKWMEDGCFPSTLNDTNLVLIPKCELSESIRDLRPISLCNVAYNIFFKSSSYPDEESVG